MYRIGISNPDFDAHIWSSPVFLAISTIKPNTMKVVLNCRIVFSDAVRLVAPATLSAITGIKAVTITTETTIPTTAPELVPVLLLANFAKNLFMLCK